MKNFNKISVSFITVSKSLNADFTLLKHSIKVDSELNLVIEKEIFTAFNSVLIQTLFNINTEINIISQHFTVEHQLIYIKSELSQSQFINN